MINSVLNIIVSYYPNFWGRAIKRNLLDYLNDRSFESKVLEIRGKTTKLERDELKEKLPGITPAAICHPTRSRKNVKRRTGLMVFDIDKISPEKLLEYFNIIIQLPYVAYCGLSVSGSGLWGLVPVSNPAKYDQHFEALQRDFKALGIDRPHFDISVKDIARYRYCSCDSNAYFNHDAKVFNRVFEDRTPSKSGFNLKPGQSGGLSPFEAFNKYGDIEELLIAHGWTYQPKYDKGSRRRYTRPGKSTGISADYCTERKVFYLFSDDPATGLKESNKGYNHTDVFNALECNYDLTLCRKKLLSKGFGVRK